MNADQVKVCSFVFLSGLQQMPPSERKQVSVGFLKRFGVGRHRYSECDKIIVFIRYTDDKIFIKKREIFVLIALYLFRREWGIGRKAAIGLVQQFKHGVYKGQKFFFGFESHYPKLVFLFDEFVELNHLFRQNFRKYDFV